MQFAFPYPVKLQAMVPTLVGLRLGGFTNIDGEAFTQPALNGFWRIQTNVVARGMQAQLALSAFITAMSSNGTCVVPVCTQWRPNGYNGRMLARGGVAPEYTFDHTGFADDPFDGFTLRAPASHRDSFVDINKPALSNLVPGHLITLEDRLYQIVKVSSIAESETAIRVSVMPNIRGNHDAGSLVIVDQLRLLCKMESGDQIGLSAEPMKMASMSFVEAF